MQKCGLEGSLCVVEITVMRRDASATLFALGFCNDYAAPPPANRLAASVDKTWVFES
jgi:hypothetical protein